MTTPRKSAINHIYKVGDCVEISQRRVAIIKYIGKLRDIRGIWYGIEFIDGSVGEHNGTYKNEIYFHGADKRCEFIQKGDIRRTLKQKSNSTRNIHSANNTLLNQLNISHDNINDQPMLPLQNHIHTNNSSTIITLKLRCMCFADPIPIELKIDINNQTMLQLKKQIIEQCNSTTNLGLFKSIIEEKSYSKSVDLYQLTMNTDKNKNNGKQTRLNNLNVKPGNMAYCILKKNSQLFTKISLVSNNNNLDDNVPLKYYKTLKNNTHLFVLFNFTVNIRIIFQKTLFMHSNESNQSDYSNESASGSDEKNGRVGGGQNMKYVASNKGKYIHEMSIECLIMDKFDKLYLKLMDLTGINNINCIKLLSNTFIYNKSMMIEKFVYNEIDEHDGHNEGELYLYFIHLHKLHENGINKERNNKNYGHHKGRTRNYSLMSNYSTYSTFTHAFTSGNNILNGNTKPKVNVNNNQKPKYTKILLNFVSAKKSESYTILDDGITIKQLRENICAKYKIECDKIKLNSNILSDNKLISFYNLKENDILHIYDESNITINISQSVLSGIDSTNKLFQIKINKYLTIKHIKFEISKILKYPMISQTLIMKEVLKDSQIINNCSIKTGDTVRLVYNFGKRVKKLPNQKIKIPIITFNTNKKFELIVNKNIYIYEIMQIIQREKGIDINKQILLFHGIHLDKEQRLNYYNITHEMHLLIHK